MENNIETKSHYLYSLLYDNYKYQLIHKFFNKKNKVQKIKEELSAPISRVINNTFENKSEKEFQNLKTILYYIPPAIVYFNGFNFLDILHKKIFVNHDKMIDILIKMYKIDFNAINQSIFNFYKLMFKSMKKTVTFNFTPFMFTNKSLIYCLTFYPFLFKYCQSNGQFSNKDYFSLFILSTLAAPFTYAQENYNDKKFIKEESKSAMRLTNLFKFQANRNFYLILIKSISHNFISLVAYFNIFHFFSKKLENQSIKLYESDKFPLLKETLDSNQTLKRVELLYMKNENITGKVDYSFPVIYTSFILSFLFTPFDFTIRWMVRNNMSFKEMVKQITENKMDSNNISSLSKMALRFKYLFFLNLTNYFFRYGIVTFIYYNILLKN